MTPLRQYATALRISHAMLLQDRRRTIGTIAGIALSYFLMVYQAGLISGFVRAAGTVVRASGADIWVSAADTPCLEYGRTIPDSLAAAVLGVSGVTDVARVIVGFGSWTGPQGEARAATIVGTEPLRNSRLPVPPGHRVSRPARHHVALDRSARSNLGLTDAENLVEINEHHVVAIASASGFSTFLGSPYVFASYADAGLWLNIPPERTMYLAVAASADNSIPRIVESLRQRFPDLQVMTIGDFARHSGLHWMLETGAGGGLALAGILGVVIGALVIAQMMYAVTHERVGEFATMLAIGAQDSLPVFIVLNAAMICVACGIGLGLALLAPMILLTRLFVVSWITFSWLICASCLLVCVVVAGLASRGSLRRVLAIDPEAAFRG